MPHPFAKPQQEMPMQESLKEIERWILLQIKNPKEESYHDTIYNAK